MSNAVTRENMIVVAKLLRRHAYTAREKARSFAETTSRLYEPSPLDLVRYDIADRTYAVRTGLGLVTVSEYELDNVLRAYDPQA